MPFSCHIDYITNRPQFYLRQSDNDWFSWRLIISARSSKFQIIRNLPNNYYFHLSPLQNISQKALKVVSFVEIDANVDHGVTWSTVFEREAIFVSDVFFLINFMFKPDSLVKIDPRRCPPDWLRRTADKYIDSVDECVWFGVYSDWKINISILTFVTICLLTRYSPRDEKFLWHSV